MSQSIKLILCTLMIFSIASCAELKAAGQTVGQASKEAAQTIGDGAKRVVGEITAEEDEEE